MRYLYRFDVLPVDGLLSDPLSVFTPAYAMTGRQVLLLTNWEDPVVIPVTSPLLASFLPPTTDVVVARTFMPAAGIQHSGITYNQERSSGELKLMLPRDHPVSRLWQDGSPQAQVWLTVASQEGDATPVVIWSGRLRSGEFSELVCTLTGTAVVDLAQRQGLNRKHSRTCPHTLYDPTSCGVNPNAVPVTGVPFYYLYREDGFLGTVSADGLTVTVPEAVNRPDGFFANDGMLIVAGGYALWHVPRLNHITADRTAYVSNRVRSGIARSIVGHAGNTLTLATPLPPTLLPGAQVTLYRGCAKTESDCNAFDNFATGYGGYPFIPIKNVFQTGLK